MLEYRRYRDAAGELRERFEAARGYLYRSAPLPPDLRQVALEAAVAVYDPERLGAALGDLLRRAAAGRRQPHPPDRLARAPPAGAARRARAAARASTSTSSSAARTG